MSTDLQGVANGSASSAADDQLLALMEENERLKSQADQLQTLVDTLKTAAGPNEATRQPGEKEFEVMPINRQDIPAGRFYGADSSEAIRRFFAKHSISDTHKYTCRAICLDGPTDAVAETESADAA